MKLTKLVRWLRPRRRRGTEWLFSTEIDSHKWESKMEIRRSLSRTPRRGA